MKRQIRVVDERDWVELDDEARTAAQAEAAAQRWTEFSEPRWLKTGYAKADNGWQRVHLFEIEGQ